jgi:hypothetical protein
MDFLANIGQVEKAKIVIKDTRPDGSGTTKKEYVVQFNPSTLTIRGRGNGYIPMMALGSNGQPPAPAQQNVRITLDAKLVIDQVHNFLAFTEDKMNLSPTQLAQNIATVVAEKAGRKPTVKDRVEGLIAALRSPYTRTIEFCWGSMHYEGVLSSVSAQYVMFDTVGHPIRAYINITLLLISSTKEVNSLGPWVKSYKDAFSGSSLDTTNGGQVATNLINLG